MSMFYCSRCAQLRDSDDGCEEVLGRLLCSYCGDEVEDDDDPGLIVEQCRHDRRPCYVSANTDDAHWRCGTSACEEAREPDTRGEARRHPSLRERGDE